MHKITDRPLEEKKKKKKKKNTLVFSLFLVASYRGYKAWARGDEEEKTASTGKQEILESSQKSREKTICFWGLH